MVLNLDNDDSKRAVEICYRTHKTLVNPIIDWSDDEVWEFLNQIAKVPHCCLYDQGQRRIGCIGCPMSSVQEKELEKYPKFKALYLKAFEKMLRARHEAGLETSWENADEVMRWWLRD